MTISSVQTQPLFSVVVVAASGAESAARTLACLRHQTVRHGIELVLVVESASAFCEANVGRNELHSVRVIEAGHITHRGAAGALGIASASAPIVALLEDHSFPEPRWAEALLEAHKGSHAGVGPAVANANPNSVGSWVNFVLSYGAFSPPVTSSLRDVLPWHNSAYKREALEPYRETLGDLLAWEGALQESLRDSGHTLFLESNAVTHHANISRVTSTLRLNFLRGRVIGSNRVQREQWSRAHRVLHTCAFPLFPLMQWLHIRRAFRREPIAPAMRFGVGFVLVPALLSMAVGEAFGIMAGKGDALNQMEDFELHRLKHVSRRDKAEAMAVLQDAQVSSLR